MAESHKSGKEAKEGTSAGHNLRGGGGGGGSSDAGFAHEGEGTSVVEVTLDGKGTKAPDGGDHPVDAATLRARRRQPSVKVERRLRSVARESQ